MSPLDAVYRRHHAEERGRDFALFPEERAVFFRAKIGRGKRVLDLGCRDCALTRLFAEGNEIIGVDVDAEALKQCRGCGFEARQLDLNEEEWRLAEGSFDAAVLGEVLEHVYYPERFLERVRRRLKPGGILVGSVPNAFSLKNRIRLLLGRKRGTPLEDPTHINHFSYRELGKLLAAAGFIAVSVKPLVVKRWLRPAAGLFPGLVGFSLLFSAGKPER